ncbi:MAG: zf-HC2 domain-containing protein [Acidobacteria bacterium]|jgi:anti-sigma factor RsiW|nr:zf-HC2 domain-containing protein [Acidobacteriota bacterium]
MSGHVTDRLALAAAEALDPGEQRRVDAHLRECPDCAAQAEQWRRLGDGLRDLPTPVPSPGLLARTRATIERRQAEREEQTWNRAALGFLIVFGWTLTGVAWLLLELLVGELALRFERPLGPTIIWFGAYLVAGWVAAAAATVLLGRRTHEEGRLA